MAFSKNNLFHKFNLVEKPNWLSRNDSEAKLSILKNDQSRPVDHKEAIRKFQSSFERLLTSEKHWLAVMAAKEAIYLKNQFGRRAALEIAQVITDRLRRQPKTTNHIMTTLYLMHLILLIEKHNINSEEILFCSAFSVVKMSETYFDLTQTVGCGILRNQLETMKNWFQLNPATNFFPNKPIPCLMSIQTYNSKAPIQVDDETKLKWMRRNKNEKKKLLAARRKRKPNIHGKNEKTKILVPSVPCLFPNFNFSTTATNNATLAKSSSQEDLPVVSPGGMTVLHPAERTTPCTKAANPKLNSVVAHKRPNELISKQFCQEQNGPYDDLWNSTPNKLKKQTNPEEIRIATGDITLAISPALITKSVGSKPIDISDPYCELNFRPVGPGLLSSTSVPPPAIIRSVIKKNAFEKRFPNVSKYLNDPLMKELVATKHDKVLPKNNNSVAKEVEQSQEIVTQKLKNPNDLKGALDISVTEQNLKEGRGFPISLDSKPKPGSTLKSQKPSFAEISDITIQEKSKIVSSQENQANECTSLVSATRKNNLCHSKELEEHRVKETKIPQESKTNSNCQPFNVDTSIGATYFPPKGKDLAMLLRISQQNREIAKCKGDISDNSDSDQSECFEVRNETCPGLMQKSGDESVDQQSSGLRVHSSENINGPGGIFGKTYIPSTGKSLSMLLLTLQKDREMRSNDDGNCSDSSSRDSILYDCRDARNEASLGLTQQPPENINAPCGLDEFPTIEELVEFQTGYLSTENSVALSNTNHSSGLQISPEMNSTAYIPEFTSSLIENQWPPYEFLINTDGIPSLLDVRKNNNKLKPYFNSNKCHRASHSVENSSYSNISPTLPPLPPTERLNPAVFETPENLADIEKKKTALKLLINPDVDKPSWTLYVPGMRLVVVKKFGEGDFDLGTYVLHPDIVSWDLHESGLPLFFYRSGNV